MQNGQAPGHLIGVEAVKNITGRFYPGMPEKKESMN
jgi:hypothetical protein